jgi:hypothetical protein
MGGPGAPDDLEKGHLTQAWLAVSDEAAATVSGRYWHHRRPEPAAREASNPHFQDQLSAKLADLTGVLSSDSNGAASDRSPPMLRLDVNRYASVFDATSSGDFVSELCQIPHETPVKHRGLQGHSDAHRCCGKLLIGSALGGAGVRQHARAESISQPLGSLRLEATICACDSTEQTANCVRPPDVARSLTDLSVWLPTLRRWSPRFSSSVCLFPDPNDAVNRAGER